MNIVFITDGGLEMGMGHIYRTIFLASELAKGNIVFFTKSDKHVIDKIFGSGFEVKGFPNDERLLSELNLLKPEVIIVDRLDVDVNFVKSIKENENRLILIENLNIESNNYADIVINALLGGAFGSKYENKKFIDNETLTYYYYGPKYLLLKDDFLSMGTVEPKEKKSAIATILLIFGGSDPSNLTCKILKELLKVRNYKRIDIILGSGFVFHDNLNTILHNSDDQEIVVNIYEDVDNVAELMASADLVITAPGLSVFEALSVKTPVMVFHHNEWQKNGFSGFMETLSNDDIKTIGTLIKMNNYLDPNSEYIKNFEIGSGKTELVNMITGSVCS